MARMKRAMTNKLFVSLSHSRHKNPQHEIHIVIGGHADTNHNEEKHTSQIQISTKARIEVEKSRCKPNPYNSNDNDREAATP